MALNGIPDLGTLVNDLSRRVRDLETGKASIPTWTPFTPVFGISVTSSTVSAIYQSNGKILNFFVELTVGATAPTTGNLTIQVPFPAKISSACAGSIIKSTSRYPITGTIAKNTNTFNFNQSSGGNVTTASPTAIATGTVIVATGSYLIG